MLPGRLWRTLPLAALLAALLAACLATSLPAQQTDDDEIETLRRQASELSRERRFAEAVPISERALMLVERQFDPTHLRIAEALGDLAYLHLAQKHYAEAEPLYRRLLSIRERGAEDGRLWLVLNSLEQIYDAQGRGADAGAFAARARAIEQRVSAPFEVDIVPGEIITTDLKRMGLADCGKVWFKVDDPRMLLMSFGDIEQARSRGRLIIASALRRVLGNMTSADVRQQAEAIATEVKRTINRDVSYTGYSVRDIAVNFGACVTWK
jgi:tetratricopeptide (TPR) repeat protein